MDKDELEKKRNKRWSSFNVGVAQPNGCYQYNKEQGFKNPFTLG